MTRQVTSRLLLIIASLRKAFNYAQNYTDTDTINIAIVDRSLKYLSRKVVLSQRVDRAVFKVISPLSSWQKHPLCPDTALHCVLLTVFGSDIGGPRGQQSSVAM